MREIIQAVSEGNSRAKLAFDMFVHKLRSHMGSMLATLGGLGAPVFTAEVGENSVVIRTTACENFRFLGINIDRAKNQYVSVDGDITTNNSQVRVLSYSYTGRVGDRSSLFAVNFIEL